MLMSLFLTFLCQHTGIMGVMVLHVELDLYNAGSLKQQSADRHVTALGNIILILSQPVYALTP
jgi:anti-anti-sigma regulatory factor